jgi:glycosyltransferase involved in cell wall biosynthesis
MSMVTVVIATLNSQRFFMQCVQSLLSQSYLDFDVVIVDGGSSDGTLEMVSLLPNAKLVPQSGRGLAAAWNEGIAHCNTPYIGFLDSDDWWEPTALSDHMSVLLSDSNLDYTTGMLRYVAEDPGALPYGFKPSLLEGLHQALMPGCFVGKRALFDSIGMFDESLSVALDIQWFHDLKLSSARRYELDAHVLNKRVHLSNLSYTSCETGTYRQELLSVVYRRLKNKGL